MLRELQTVNQAGLSPHEMHCHQYLAMHLQSDHRPEEKDQHADSYEREWSAREKLGQTIETLAPA